MKIPPIPKYKRWYVSMRERQKESKRERQREVEGDEQRIVNIETYQYVYNIH